eukprot:TRINITY_DN17604_c0_g1_i1.p1 TRINITY_DN17604_c0_g1~~TRINITY_DN17604_c0_g1_i1.p1  ORF type:complete len:403 (+),score=20.73 TRINITY_DN17604_c0_g1_i1:51-1211(+)
MPSRPAFRSVLITLWVGFTGFLIWREWAVSWFKTDEYHVQEKPKPTIAPSRSPPVVFIRNNKSKRKTDPPLTSAPPSTPQTPVPTQDLRSKSVLTLIDIPHGGGETIDCTLGPMRRHHVDKTREARPVSGDGIEYLTESSFKNAQRTLKRYGSERGFLHIHPEAVTIFTMSFKDPILRYHDAFQASLAGHTDSWQCSDSFRMPRNVNALINFNSDRLASCEQTRNVYVKTLLGLDLRTVATKQHLSSAISIIRGGNFTVFFEDEAEKSLYSIYRLSNTTLPKNKYFRCRPYPPEEPRLREALRVKIYSENTHDLALYQEARHVFYTRWASRHEATYVSGSCEPPSLCWDDSGFTHMAKRSVKALKSLPVNAVNLLAHPFCSEACTM